MRKNYVTKNPKFIQKYVLFTVVKYQLLLN